ncbi:MAG: type I-C CRISPR-associated protein Cas7/Csd2 [Verrucomicrobiales bacterium]|nr:type I-C CRISPR-associated protein Cas7/Csd2 [Verrucomicrobiales bacterium]
MNHRYDFLYLYDCTDANPNGDPDAGNLPRLDPETGQGLATDVMLKRKIRNFVQLTKDGQTGYEIYVKEKAILNNQHARAYTELKLDPKKAKQDERDKTKSWMCQQFYDIRTFGAVMTTEVNCGQVRGPVQLSFSRSIDRIVSAEHAVTRMAVTTEKEAEKQSGDNRTMGRKFTVPYALYKAQGFVNPFLAAQTGFSDDDLEVLFTSLENAFQFDQSAARPAGSMAPRELLIFKHDSQLGSAPSHKLFDLVTVKKKDEVDVPRSYSDYEVTVDESAIPEGVTLIRRI